MEENENEIDDSQEDEYENNDEEQALEHSNELQNHNNLNEAHNNILENRQVPLNDSKKEDEDNINLILNENQQDGDTHHDMNNLNSNREDCQHNTEEDLNQKFHDFPLDKDNQLLKKEKQQQTEEPIEEINKVPLEDYEKALDQIIFAACQKETTQIFAMAYVNEKTIYQRKISTMKLMIQDLHSKFESELNKKDKLCMDKLFIITKRYEEIKKKEGDYVKTIKALDDINKTLKNNISSVSKEKMDLEDVIFRQEEKLSILAGRVGQIEQLLSKKNRMIKENEAYAMELIAIVEEQKKEIKTLKSKGKQDLSGMPLDSYDLQNQVRIMKKELEEKNMRIKLYESDTSGIYMKNSMNFGQGKDGGNDITGIGFGNNNNNNSKSFNEALDAKGSSVNINANGSGSYLPPLNKKNTTYSPSTYNEDNNKEKLDEFKSMMDKLLEEINE